MALDNYANLQEHIITISCRNDIARILPDFIQEAENAMYGNPDESLLLADMEVRSRATLSTTERFLAKPDQWVKMFAHIVV